MPATRRGTRSHPDNSTAADSAVNMSTPMKSDSRELHDASGPLAEPTNGHDEWDLDPTLSEYERARLRKISENREMMAKLGLGMGGPLNLSPSGAQVVQPRRVAAPRKRKVAATSGPARRSSRLKGEQAADVYVTRDAAGTIGIAGSGASSLGGADKYIEAVEPSRPSRLPEETLTLESTGGTEEYGRSFLKKLRQLSKTTGSGKEQRRASSSGTGSLDRNVLKYAERLSKLSLGDFSVAKVCPDRIYSCVVHPSTNSLLVTCGDKAGTLGMWRVGDDQEDAVVQYQPHTGCINMLQYHPNNAAKLYSASYDCSVRCLDVETGQFEYVTGTKGDDGWLQHGCLTPDGRTLYTSSSDGTARCLDLRSNKVAWQAQLHDRKVNTIDVHPTDPHYLVTASLDQTVRLWDARSIRGARAKSAQLALLPDSRSVNSASFSPGGDRIVSVTQNHKIHLYVNAHTKSGRVAATHSIAHDNKTGRWLAVFHARWDPKTDHAFAIGSMARPRQVEVYSTDGGKIRRIMSMQDPEQMGSVQSRLAFHPSQDVLVACNSSGRVHAFR
eukprot:m.163870 g.163870  ORF g.163870 m.163870 type:complete len:556 (+) comp12348_c0_seq1:134-1801(+)